MADEPKKYVTDYSDDQSDENKYIVFELDNEQFGVRLLEVREVVETGSIKKIPNTVKFFKGVCNLRGQIIGVIDLKARFDMETGHNSRPVLLVFESEAGAISVEVDKIISVSVIAEDEVERRPNIVSTIPPKFILGVGKLESRLVTILSLQHVLSSDEITELTESKLIAKAS